VVDDQPVSAVGAGAALGVGVGDAVGVGRMTGVAVGAGSGGRGVGVGRLPPPASGASITRTMLKAISIAKIWPRRWRPLARRGAARFLRFAIR